MVLFYFIFLIKFRVKLYNDIEKDDADDYDSSDEKEFPKAYFYVVTN